MTEKKKKPLVTAVLVVLNILVFVLVEWQMSHEGTSGIYRSFIMTSYAGRVDTVWHKLVTSMFLHADFNHLIHNMIGLAMFGYVLEGAIGHMRFLGGYLFSGVAASVVSLIVYAVNGVESQMLGASGAVCGIIGMCLVYGIVCVARHESSEIDFKAVAFSLVYTIYYGFTVSNVNNTAHIAGAVAGILFGMVFLTFPSRKMRSGDGTYAIWPKYLITLLVTAVLVSGGVSLFCSHRPELAEEIGGYIGQLRGSFEGWSLEDLLDGSYEEDSYELVDRVSSAEGVWEVMSAGINSEYANDPEAKRRGMELLTEFRRGTQILVMRDKIFCANRTFSYLVKDFRIVIWGDDLDETTIIAVRNGDLAQVQVNGGEFLINLQRVKDRNLQ